MAQASTLTPDPSLLQKTGVARRMLHALRGEHALALGGALLLATLQWFPAFSDVRATGFGDWQMIHHNWEAAYIALARFGEWPLWDPFHCGGVSILGNPESQVYAPLFWLSFALGSVLAVKLFLLLHIAAALLGMYWLARREYAAHPVAAALAALAWALSGCFAWDGAGGHATFLPFAFAPWLVLCFRRCEAQRAYVIAVAALLALTLLEGGTYPFPYFLLLLGFELAAKLIASPARKRVLADAGAIALLTLLLGAIRLIPIAIALHDTPRLVESADSLGLRDILLMLTAREHEWRFLPHVYVWPEYGSYVGWPVVLFAAAGAVLCALRGPRHLIAGALLFLLLTLGSPAPYFPWPLLHHFPVFDSLRVPSRFAMLFTFYLALLAGIAFDRALRLLRMRRWLLVVATLLVMAQARDMLLVNYPIVSEWVGPPLFVGPGAQQFQLVRERDYGNQYASYPRRNVGTDICYVGGMTWPVSPALWSGARPQVKIANAHGSVLAWGKTSRRAYADVELDSAARLIFNFNFAHGFVSSVGQIAADRGRLAVDVPAGKQHVEVEYAPRWFAPSAALSLLGLALSLLWLRVLIARRSR